MTDKTIRELLEEHLEEKGEQKIEALNNIAKIKKNYPSFLPKKVREFPASYLTAFYPHLEKSRTLPYPLRLADAFPTILAAKAENRNMEKFVVKSGSAHIVIPVTEKEVAILIPYTEMLTRSNEKTLRILRTKSKKKRLCQND